MTQSDWARLIGPGGGPNGVLAIPEVGDEVWLSLNTVTSTILCFRWALERR
jgi:hypothetical protein